MCQFCRVDAVRIPACFIAINCSFHSGSASATLGTPETPRSFAVVAEDASVASCSSTEVTPAAPVVVDQVRAEVTPAVPGVVDQALLSVCTRAALESQRKPSEQDWREIYQNVYETHKKTHGNR